MNKKNMFKLVTLTVLFLCAITLLSSALASESATFVLHNATTTVKIYSGMKTQMRIKKEDSSFDDPRNYQYTSSKTSVATVNNKGIVYAMKPGKATITAKNKNKSSDVTKLTIIVKQNKTTNNPKPSISSTPYKMCSLIIRSIQIVSPTRVDVDYYLVSNFPSNWRISEVKMSNEFICAYNSNTDEFVDVIVDGRNSKISGFKPMNGKSIQIVKFTYTGNAVINTNLQLSNYNIVVSPKCETFYDEL